MRWHLDRADRVDLAIAVVQEGSAEPSIQEQALAAWEEQATSSGDAADLLNCYVIRVGYMARRNRPDDVESALDIAEAVLEASIDSLPTAQRVELVAQFVTCCDDRGDKRRAAAWRARLDALATEAHALVPKHLRGKMSAVSPDADPVGAIAILEQQGHDSDEAAERVQSLEKALAIARAYPARLLGYIDDLEEKLAEALFHEVDDVVDSRWQRGLEAMRRAIEAADQSGQTRRAIELRTSIAIYLPGRKYRIEWATTIRDAWQLATAHRHDVLAKRIIELLKDESLADDKGALREEAAELLREFGPWPPPWLAELEGRPLSP
jgi:hypothetical protein